MSACRVIPRYCHGLVNNLYCSQRRHFSSTLVTNKGLVLCVYEPKEKNGELVLGKAAGHYDGISSGRISSQLKIAGRKLKRGGCRLLYGVVPGYDSVAVCCLGKQGAGFNEAEQWDEKLENIRTAVASGVTSLRDVGETEIDVDPCGSAEASAEGAYLRLHSYDELKSKEKRKAQVRLTCLQDQLTGSGGKEVNESWMTGKVKAAGQNWARTLMEAPSNRMTPRLFAQVAEERLSNKSNITITVRHKAWIEEEKMGAFLAVSQGSAEPPVFLHIQYHHPDSTMDSPVALVGKGVTFDTGGISLKPSASMDQMRADMGGAACVVGTMDAISQLNIPAHVHAFIPLCENMPGGRAIKPGDVVFARNGKSIEIDNTDAEGRLILADALNYAETFQPQMILDMATLTGAIDVALGSAAVGVYSTSTPIWDLLLKAGGHTGDRVWRMPLFNHYTKQVTDCMLGDVNNIGKYARSGGSCTAAAFLKEFVTNKNWVHVDIAGVMSNKDEVPYLGKGMAGRPTRTIVEFIRLLAKQNN